MSADVEIQSAIDKLGRLKSRGSDGQWRATVSSGTASITNDVGRGVAHYVPAPDAELIVTLHATVGVLLDILHGALEEAEMGRAYPQFSGDKRDLALARVINGGV